MCSTSAPEHKRKVGNMHQMKEELMRRKKKGKLPAGATEALKSWWDQNREWPYPTEEQKRRLLESTGLNTTGSSISASGTGTRSRARAATSRGGIPRASRASRRPQAATPAASKSTA
uniref:Homeobox protein knotted-1-like 3-like n=1 Tax=Tetraselmis sp. GSL018 TaxID=582737 RepID=A0A061QMY8_9CHLO